MKKHFFQAIALFLALFLLIGTVACSPDTPDDKKEDEKMKDDDKEPTPTVDPIDLETLRQIGENSQRWLSVPFSRLVLNPYEFNVSSTLTHSDYCDRPSLPLNIGYLDPYTTSGTGVWLENMITLYENQGQNESSVNYQYEGDVWSWQSWQKSGGSFTELGNNDDDALTITVHTGDVEPWQYVAQPIDLDLSVHPILTVTIDSCGGSWALKLCETGKEDVTIQGDSSKTGTFTYDIAMLLERENNFKGVIKLFSIGFEKTLACSRLDIMKVDSNCAEAKTYKTEWVPAALDFSATYPGGMTLTGYDTFYDADTVLRYVEITAPGSLTAAGLIDGKAKLSGDNTVIVSSSGGKYNYALSWSGKAKPVFYDDLTHLLANSGGRDTASGAQYFSLTFENLKAGDHVTFSFTLLSDASTAADCANANASVLSDDNCAKAAREKWEKYWSDYLCRVPRPGNFTISAVDAMKVTADQVEQMYYIAWIFLGQNTLPENPEISYPYPQVCCGKPSMWAYGDPKSAYSASWESFFGIQLLGYVMPDKAWSAFEGLVSLISPDGMLGGESLPSEKAHTAYLLYQLTGDKEKLASVYDGIDRYLKWRIENPRWIFQEHNDVNSADADFVVSGLVDIQYLLKICDVIGKADEKAAWEKRYNDFLNNYYQWNFDEKGNVYQYCNKVNFTRSSGCTIWTTKGWLIDALDDAHKGYLMKRFKTEYKAGKTFCNFTGVKYPETSQTILGLYKIGEKSIARILAESSARDVVRCGMLSENYTNYSVAEPTGVRPAMFGCAMMIDSVLVMNGFSYQDAAAIDLGTSGTTLNVRIQNEFKLFPSPTPDQSKGE